MVCRSFFVSCNVFGLFPEHRNIDLTVYALVPYRFGLYCHARQLVAQASGSAETVDSCAIIHYIGLFVYVFVYERLSRKCIYIYIHI